MQINLNVEYTDGTKAVRTAKSVDFIAFERTYNVSIQKLERLEHLAFLAWNVEKRTKTTGLEFDPWLENIEDVTADEPKKSKG